MNRCRFLLILCALLFCVSCASQGARTDSEDLQKTQRNIDPLEGINRKVFAFNSVFDRFLLRPIAKGYAYVVPKFAKKRIGNFFSNVGEVGNIVNDALQWKWKKVGNDTGRLVTNSTIGLVGFFDVASKFGLEKSDGEDVGQTFEYWGIKSGPYVVLPFFGPSTIREAVASPFDGALNPISYIDDNAVRFGLIGTNIVHTRYKVFELESLVSGDRYLFVRDAYLQRREFLYNDGLIEVDEDDEEFGDEDF